MKLVVMCLASIVGALTLFCNGAEVDAVSRNGAGLKAVEEFVDEYVGVKFWQKELTEKRIVRMKKKFRYCDLAEIRCTYSDVMKVTEIRVFCVLEDEYEYEALKRECDSMLKALDAKFGIKEDRWDVKRSIEGVYSYEAEPWLDSKMLMGGSGPKRQCICVTFERMGMPPKDGLRKQLPPL